MQSERMQQRLLRAYNQKSVRKLLPLLLPLWQLPRCFTVQIRDLTGGQTVPVKTSAAMLVGQLKQRVEAMTGVAAAAQKLLFAGREIQDQCSVNDYNLMEQTVLHLISRVPKRAATRTEMSAHGTEALIPGMMSGVHANAELDNEPEPHPEQQPQPQPQPQPAAVHANAGLDDDVAMRAKMQASMAAHIGEPEPDLSAGMDDPDGVKRNS